ncbi:conserved exported hypothetical protein [Burkholderiales bacterium]|nr:conserved exported hypothetical protein [Burkholderiales bacterium]
MSLHFYHQLPDIAGVAVVALVLKMACAASGFLLLAAYLLWGSGWVERKRILACYSSSILAAIALSAAAFLRWFS